MEFYLVLLNYFAFIKYIFFLIIFNINQHFE